MNLQEIRIRNVRLLPASGLTLELSRRICILAGENGEGKTTVLDSIGFLLGANRLGREDIHRSADGRSAGWLSVGGVLAGEGGERCEVQRTLGSGVPAEVEGMAVIRLPGAARCRVANPLADNNVLVRGAAERMLEGRFGGGDLPGAVDERGGICADRPVAWKELSSGYRAAAGMAAEIARGLMARHGAGERALSGAGVVLIDEVELHLHPRLQRTVLVRLASMFEGVQFFVTTHSAVVVAGGSGEADVVRLRRGGIAESLRGAERMDVGGLLMSELFGLQWLHAPQWDAASERRDEILGMERLTPALERELEGLDALLEGVSGIGTGALLRAARVLRIYGAVRE